MKYLSMIAAMLLLAFSTIAQVLFEENFDNCTIPTDWTSNAVTGSDDWQFGNNSGDNVDGTCMAFFDDDIIGDLAPFSLVELESPTMDLTAIAAAELTFNYIFEDLGTSAFHVLLWNGTDWDTAFTEITDPGCFGWYPICTPRTATVNITSHLSANFKFKFVYDDGDDWSWYVGVDNIQIIAPAAEEAELTSIDSPTDGCGLTMVDITLAVTNNGSNTITSIDASYDIDGSGAINETFAVSIPFGATSQITFANQFDASAVGTYNVEAWIDLLNDTIATNDTLTSTFSNIPVISGLPYFEDFENGDGGWIAGGTASTWELGLPTNVFIDTAFSGVNSWVTNLTGPYNNSELSYVESPCMDFSSLLIDPILSFAQIYSTESCCDEAYVDISLDAGVTWTRLGLAGQGTNWYNDTFANEWDGTSGAATEWRTATHLIDGAAGQSSVKLRIGFSSDGSITDEGFGFDDISITEQPPINAELTAIESPLSACGLGMEEVTVIVSNLGSETMDSVMVSYSIDGGIAIMETFNDTIQPNEVDTFTFSTLADLSMAGDYELTCVVTTIGDGDMTNDTMVVTVQSIPTISGLPYFIDFENGSGGWSSTNGTNGNWELGDPVGTLIDDAYSGTNAWATNLTTLNYQNSQFSTLTSPCIDLSTLTDAPILSFATIFNSEFNYDAFFVESSIDGGATWTLVGNMGDGINWYTNDNFFNAAIDQGFAGNSADPVDWIESEIVVPGVAGMSDVQFRFVFASDGSVNGYEGAAIDDIALIEQPQHDLVAFRMDGPMSNCGLTDETVVMSYWNRGLQTQTSYEVGYTVNGNTVTETSNITIAQGDTATYTFTTPADLSTPGDHSITVFTALAADEVLTNDTVYNNLVTNHQGTPLTQSSSQSIAFAGGEGPAISNLFFCDMPSMLDGCFGIDYISIDNLTHSWIADLTITLVSPTGDSLLLSQGNGCCAGGAISGVIFADGNNDDITLEANGIDPGTYNTQDPGGIASLYTGQNPNGAWQLIVEDPFFGDVGSLNGWTIAFSDQNPQPELSFGDTTICVNHVIELSATSGMDSYLWSTFDNGPTLTIDGAQLGAGDHDISVLVDLDGCTGHSETITITVDECVGIEEANAFSIHMYPNPTSGIITLNVISSLTNAQLSVVETTGKVVHTETISSQSQTRTIDLSHLAAGVYHVQLVQENVSLTEKLFIR